MKILKCKECGFVQPEGTQCINCKSSSLSTVAKTNLDKKVRDEFLKLENLIRERQFKQAVDLSYSLGQQIPQEADLYWLRLLAQNNCKEASELVYKGFNVNTNPSFLNALRFSDQTRKEALENIKQAVKAEQDSLSKRILKNKVSEKKRTGINSRKKEIDENITACKTKLITLNEDLQKTENELTQIGNLCLEENNEFLTLLQTKSTEASNLLFNIKKLKAVNDKDKYQYQISIGQCSAVSDQALKSFKDNQEKSLLLKKRDDLRRKQNEIVNQIEYLFNSIDKNIAELQNLLSSVEDIDSHYQLVQDHADEYRFEKARSFLE